METTVVGAFGGFRNIAAKIARDLGWAAAITAGIGLAIYGAGWLWITDLAAAQAPPYPPELGAFAGLFVGMGVDLGILAGLAGLVNDVTSKIRRPSTRAEESAAEPLLSIAPH